MIAFVRMDILRKMQFAKNAIKHGYYIKKKNNYLQLIISATCDGLTSSDCVTCVAGSLTFSSGECNCPAQQFYSVSATACTPCHYSWFQF